jgi:hypothetical protein
MQWRRIWFNGGIGARKAVKAAAGSLCTIG